MFDKPLYNVIKLVVAMLIMGSIGIFVTYIHAPRSVIALFRAVIGAVILFPFYIIERRKKSTIKLRKNIIYLVLSGVALGFNWMLLFEAYNYTTVQTATLCYYMAPIFVIIASPVFLKEKLTAVNIICTFGAAFGAVLVSGALGGRVGDVRGILYGLSAAILYASIIIFNKMIDGISGIARTFIQLLVSAFVMAVYTAFTVDFSGISLTGLQICLVAILGVLHTGIVYILFFSAISKLPAQTASVLGYIDLVSAIIFSAVFLKESMGLLQIVGMIMIVGFALLNEYKAKFIFK